MSSLALILVSLVTASAQPGPDPSPEPVADDGVAEPAGAVPAPPDAEPSDGEPAEVPGDDPVGDGVGEDTGMADADQVDGAAVTGAALAAVEAHTPPAPAQFLAGNDVTIDDAGGDVIAMGNRVRVVSPVGDNAVLMGRQVTIRADTKGDVLAMGQIIKVDAEISGDLYALGAEVQLTEDGSVGGTILGTAQRIVVEGEVLGDVSLRSELLELDGPVRGDASLTFGTLELGKDAVIEGDLRYVAPNVNDPLVGVTRGEASYSLTEEVTATESKGAMATVKSLARGALRVLGSYLAQLIVGAGMLLLLGDFARRPAKTISQQPLISLVLGAAVLVAIPVLTIVLGFAFTVLWRDVDLLSGMIAAATPPLGAAAVTVWGFGFIVGRILTALTLGDLLLRRVAPDRADHSTMALAAGLVPLVLLSAVPWLDFAVWGVATALGLGGTWLYLRFASKQGLPDTPG